LYDLVEQKLNREDENYTVTFYDKKIESIDILPENLQRVIKKSEEMNFKEILAYIKSVERQGYDATSYRVDLHAKLAFPLVCLIMSLVGTGIAFRGKMKEGLPVSIAYGIGTAFLYWIFYSFCVSLGYGEMLPPIIAAWTANFIFLAFAVFVLLNAE
jgi:lipopolysaccharide export system permease protein